jgi:two-component system, chemotaxis family, protein-glutamate methylesterase/glutaminase
MKSDTHERIPVRVLVADDSAFMRTAIKRLLEADPDIKVVGTAEDGRAAVERCVDLDPDVVTLDIEMPRMTGFQALQQIMQQRPRPVIMVSSLTSEGAESTLEALSLGAFDCIPKPMSHASLDIVRIQEDLIAKVKAAFANRQRYAEVVRAAAKPHALELPQFAAPLSPVSTVPIIALGCSTGGPAALQQILPSLPANLPAAVLIVQHMPIGFTAPFARRLNSLSQVRVEEAVADQVLEPGRVLIAPAGFHSAVYRKTASRCAVRLTQDRQEKLHMPSVDLMMLSVAETCGPSAIGVILTGMGADGCLGMQALHKSGAWTIGQDEASCVVYGMPRACAEVHALDRTSPLGAVASEIVKALPRATARSAQIASAGAGA